ncbi:hypothetical protein [Geodermatophilus amargosae]|uniref:hypothetical protein n=1 Tax=Geodermatophilus amargosae TaxID=1296565 RepID=UPI0034DE978E
MRRALPWALAALGAGLAVAGVAVFWWTNTHPGGAGAPRAHAPLVPDSAYTSTLTLTFDGGAVLWERGHLVGAGLVAAGILVLTAVGGWALGRRSGRRRAG